MACSKFEYVKHFESSFLLLPSTFIVVRLDGKGFTKFSELHSFIKPNDIRSIGLMNKSAEMVLSHFCDIWLAYGQSDEYSFILKKNTTLFNRRSEKILSCIVSCFSSAFALNFKGFFPEEVLKEIPIFDGRCVCYPEITLLRDYLSWRQADCHVNNLYNTCFWALVNEKKYTPKEAYILLKDIKSDQKNELLFKDFNINYNNIEAVFRKGTILIRKEVLKDKHLDKNKTDTITQGNQEIKEEKSLDNPIINIPNEDEKSIKEHKKKGIPSTHKVIIQLHEDLIGNNFWVNYKEDLVFE